MRIIVVVITDNDIVMWCVVCVFMQPFDHVRVIIVLHGPTASQAQQTVEVLEVNFICWHLNCGCHCINNS